MEKKDRAVATLAKNSLMAFTIATHRDYEPSWHHRLIVEKLEAVERGDIDRLMIFMPPRHGKSELASIRFPAWYIGKNPHKQIICNSYTSDLAQDFGRKVRNLISDERYQAIFHDVQLSEDSKAKNKFDTNKGGTYISTGIGGAITGRGADLLILDDPIKGREDADSETIREKVWNYYSSVAYTRLEKNGAVVLIQTRWHEDDIGARLLEQMEKDGDKWEVLDLPAICTKTDDYRKEGDPLWPEKYTTDDLMRIKQAIAPRDWYALYQQTPTGREAQEFYSEWFKYYDYAPDGLTILLAVDPAFSKNKNSDYTAIIVVGKKGDETYILDYVNKRLGEDPYNIAKEVVELCRKYNPYKIGVEAFAAQAMLGHYLREKLMASGISTEVLQLRIPNMKNSDIQKSRVRSLVGRYRDGKIHHKRWMTEIEDQLLKFPTGKHDDLIDCLSFFDHFKIEFTNFNNDEADYFDDLGVNYNQQFNEFGEPIYV